MTQVHNEEIQTDSTVIPMDEVLNTQALNNQVPIEDEMGLLSVNEETYKENYTAHRFEQYKLYVEMADRISSRRMLANSFFLTINTTLIAILTALISKLEVSLIWLIPSLIVALTLCFAWWRMVKSYGQLNSGKYKVVNEMEKYLPIKPYAAEWVILEEGKNSKIYRPLTRVENWIPILFGGIYIVFSIILFFNANDITKKPDSTKEETVVIPEKVDTSKKSSELPKEGKTLIPKESPENSEK